MPLKKIRIKKYPYQIMNYELILNECVVYIDESIDEKAFNPSTDKHSLPKFEQARALVILLAKQKQLINLTEPDKKEGVVGIYVRACKRELEFGMEQDIKAQLKTMLEHLQSL